MSETKKIAKRRVLEAYTRDVGRGVCRLDYDSMDELDIATGDPLQLKYKNRITGAKALPLYPSDEGKSLIRIDSLVRQNLQMQIGEEVEITKIEISPAMMVTVYPIQDIPPLDERYLADALESVPTVVGDIVVIPYFGGRLRFKVKKTDPAGIVLITQATNFTILQEDLPDELQDLEKHIEREKNKLLREVKKQINECLKQKDYEKIKELTKHYDKKIDELADTLKLARRILITKEEGVDD